MKRIYIYLLSAIASLAFVPVVSAQTTIADVIGTASFADNIGYTINKNVALRKQVSSPDANGTYWLKMEAFATGEAAITTTSTPSDVLLVLDVSTSMKNYDYGSVKRLVALKTAVKAFIKSLYDNDVANGEGYAGNRVGIVSFGSSDSSEDLTNGWTYVKQNKDDLDYIVDQLAPNGNGTWTSSGLRIAIDNYLDGNPTSARSVAKLTVVIFTDGEPATAGSGNLEIDGYTIRNLHTNDNKFSSYIANNAVYYAHQLKQTYKAKVFTVSVLGSDASDNRIPPFVKLLSSDYPNATALDPATNASYVKPYDASGTGSALMTNAQILASDWNWTYNNGVIEATGLSYGSASTDTDQDGNLIHYYQDASNSDLTSIFEAIASQSGGASNTSLTAATTAVDIVSASYVFPDGTDADDIYVFTAKCSYANHETKSYTFEPEKAKNATDRECDDNIHVEKEGNQISVTGFNYSEYWCGPVTSSTETTYRGYKLIFLIPIQMNPNAVGGPNVKTNMPGSGIYVNATDDDPLVEFDFPKVSLPVNIFIEKSGLRAGESAKFIIEKAILPDSGNPAEVAEDDWSYVTSVFVTNPQNSSSTGDPIVKIKGLPATKAVGNVQKGLVYRIREEGWSWSYTRDPNPTRYTVSKSNSVDNPFVFDNSKKSNIDIKVRHAESKATNTFKTGGGFTYDDSKTNERP